MDDARTTTLLVEPDPGGHHFQAVGTVAALAARTGPVVLLTSRGASAAPSFDVYLGDVVARGDLVVEEVFDAKVPPTAQMAQVAAQRSRRATGSPVTTVVLMDGDQALKRWWLVAPRHLRTMNPRPRVVFMLTRYPARLAATDLTGWRLRGPKAVLAAVAMATGSLHRAAGFSGREDTARGWLVKRVRDPHYASAHARDRAHWRAVLGLPADRHLVGIFGEIGERKNAPLIFDAVRASGLDAVLVLAGSLDDATRAWVAGLGPDDRERLVVRDAFLSNEDLDRMVAAVDVVPLALTNNGPSGIMGKAAAAGVPVVTTGSTVREREVRSTGTGLACDFTAESIGAAIREVVAGSFTLPAEPAAGGAEVTPQEFAMTLLGVDADGRRPRRRRVA
jgi:glycosyltransferase involved in cell wall biosynthesis